MTGVPGWDRGMGGVPSPGQTQTARPAQPGGHHNVNSVATCDISPGSHASGVKPTSDQLASLHTVHILRAPQNRKVQQGFD